MTGNEYIDPTNYFEGYQESINSLKNNPELVAFDKYCFEVFENNETGKMLMSILERRFLLPSLAHVGAPNYQIAVIHSEGIKETIRILKSAVVSHKQRIQAEINKA